MASLGAVDDVRCGVETAVAPGLSPQVVAVLVVLQAASVQMVVASLIAQFRTLLLVLRLRHTHIPRASPGFY